MALSAARVYPGGSSSRIKSANLEARAVTPHLTADSRNCSNNQQTYQENTKRRQAGRQGPVGGPVRSFRSCTRTPSLPRCGLLFYPVRVMLLPCTRYVKNDTLARPGDCWQDCCREPESIPEVCRNVLLATNMVEGTTYWVTGITQSGLRVSCSY